PGALATWPRRREPLAWIGEAARIERGAHALHEREILRRKHRRHVLRFVGADAVLACQRSARLDAVRQDLGGDLRRLVRLARHALVVADQRMQIAIAGVEDVADAQTRSAL